MLAAAGLLAAPAAASDLWSALRERVTALDQPLVELRGARSWGAGPPALQLPIPYTLEVPVEMPAHARLRLLLSLREAYLGQSMVGDTEPTRLVVSFTPDGGPGAVLVDRVLDPRARPGDRRWIPAVADCAGLAGRRGTLAFHAETAGAADKPGRTFALFGRPNLYDPVFQRAQPNLLLITIDALRADHLSSYGYARPTSPQLDRLAAGGIRYAHAFSNAPMTVPSLPQLFTSAYFPSVASPTLLSSLFAAGVPVTQAIARNPYLHIFLTFDARDSFDRLLPVDVWHADKITRAALEFVDHHRGERWALYLHYLDTHSPYSVPDPEALHFADRDYRGPIAATFGDAEGAADGIYGDADRRRIVDLYDGAIRWTDQQVGALLDGLEQRGLLDHTMVVVTADHGEELFDHGRYFHGQSLYDELLHVPLIVRLPGGARAGTVVDEMVQLVDVVPGIADALRLPRFDAWEGRSLLEPVRQPGAESRPVFARAANADHPWRFGVRTATHKLILTVDPPAEQLFDLVADPGEQVNRLDDPALERVRADLRERLAGFRAPLAQSGFQLRALAPPGMASVLEVRVRSTRGDTGLANPDRIGPLRSDRLQITPDGKTLTWRTVVPDHPIGIRFDRGVLPTYTFDVGLEFSVRALGAIDVAPRGIVLGEGGHPPSSPFTFEVKPQGLFGKPVEEPPLRAAAPPADLRAVIGEPATLYVWLAGAGPQAATPQPAAPLDDEQRRKLRALGYAE